MSQNVPGDLPVEPQPEQPAAPGYAAPAAPAYGAVAQQPKGLAITALVLGIAGIVLAWIPGVNWVALPAAIVGLILGIIALKKGQPRGMALTGIILGAIAIVFAIIGIILFLTLLGAVGAAISSGSVSVS